MTDTASTTDDIKTGLAVPRLDRAQRLAWAIGILHSSDPQSIARRRRACHTILSNTSADDHETRQLATNLLQKIE